jgi:Recombinase
VPDAVTAKPKRLHVERRINEAEAAVIREIFEKAAAGWGTRGIAHDLNARGIGAPMPRRAERPRGWAPSTIYAMLTRGTLESRSRTQFIYEPGAVCRPRRQSISRPLKQTKVVARRWFCATAGHAHPPDRASAQARASLASARSPKAWEVTRESACTQARPCSDLAAYPSVFLSWLAPPRARVRPRERRGRGQSFVPRATLLSATEPAATLRPGRYPLASYPRRTRPYRRLGHPSVRHPSVQGDHSDELQSLSFEPNTIGFHSKIRTNGGPTGRSTSPWPLYLRAVHHRRLSRSIIPLGLPGLKLRLGSVTRRLSGANHVAVPRG